jgi:hypothetical protein
MVVTVLAKDVGKARGRRSAHKARVYVLVDVAGECHEEVASALRCKPGVVMADNVEAQQKVIMVVEAQDRQRLAELTVRALASVETVIEGMHLLPAEDHRTPRFDKESHMILVEEG